MFFLNSTSAWLAGDSGLIMKSTDGGNNWIVQYSNQTYKLNDIISADTNYIWAVGTGGKILHSSDGGDNWSEQISNTTYDLRAVFFVDSANGWISGDLGIILRTIDCGINWNAQTTGLSNNIFDIEFINDSTGIAVCSNNLILRTVDYGLNWTALKDSVDSEIKYFRDITSLCFIDSLNGYILTEWGVARINNTTDGGLTWNALPQLTQVPFGNLFFTDQNNGWVVSIYGNIYHLTDSSATWENQSPRISTLRNIYDNFWETFFIDENLGWFVGANSIIFRTTDGGSSFIADNLYADDFFNSIYFVDQYHGYIAGVGS